MRIGIDVGGTNTDAVLLDGRQVLASIKTSTTEDVTSGIVAAINGLQQQRAFDLAAVQAVMIGTTHFINALVEAHRLAPTAAVRLSLPAGASLPPMVDWPQRLVDAVSGRSYLVHGGHEFDGRHIAELDESELRKAAEDMGAIGVRSVAITSVFSPVNAEFEARAAEIIAAQLPDVAISLSHEIGRIGLLERENATVINAALRELAAHIVDGLAASVSGAGITAPLYLSQNDGTLMDVDFARRYPVATFASGPTNSMRGAAVLSGLDTCAVVDVGGTTSDVGVLRQGFPREATTDVSVAGIRTNFRMPDVLSIGIGGGSRVRGGAGDVTVGPDSVGYELTSKALVFGGDTLTATDIAVAAGRAEIGDPSLVAYLDRDLVRAALEKIAADVSDVVERMRTSAEPLPVVAVGGGSVLLPDELADAGKVHRPENYAVANATGAEAARADVVPPALAVAAGAVQRWLLANRLELERDARSRTALLGDLLRLDAEPGADLRRRAADAGWRLGGWHVGLRIGVASSVDTVARTTEVVRALRAEQIAAVVVEHGDGWTGWVTFDQEPTAERVRTLAAGLRAAHKALRRTLGAHLGVGRPHPRPDGLAATIAEATDAARLAATRPESGHFLHVDQLGMAQLLLEWTRTDTFEPAARALVAPLRNAPGDLVRTLAVYLDAESSIAETAAVLGVHRNTVTARVARIEQLLGVDLSRPDDRLALHLASRAITLAD